MRTIVVIIVLALATLGFFVVREQSKNASIKTFDDCVALGYPVLESFPEQCMANGRAFIKELSD